MSAHWESRMGGFARMFPRDTPEQLAGALASAGLTQIQLNVSALGLPTIPSGAELAALDLAEVSGTFASHGLNLWGLSATYNMAHPDEQLRRDRTLRAAEYLRAIPAGIVTSATLCTGSRHAEDQWRAHPDNRTEAAWRDFRAELELLLDALPADGPVLGIEPEPGNVVADADAALRLIDELGDSAARIGIILDPANLVTEHPRAEHGRVLADAFARLGTHTVCLHVKDTVAWEQTLAGHGVVDYESVVEFAAELDVPLIIQDATEHQVPEILKLLRNAIARTEAS